MEILDIYVKMKCGWLMRSGRGGLGHISGTPLYVTKFGFLIVFEESIIIGFQVLIFEKSSSGGTFLKQRWSPCRAFWLVQKVI